MEKFLMHKKNKSSFWWKDILKLVDQFRGIRLSPTHAPYTKMGLK
jgi:hypothetical protein